MTATSSWIGTILQINPQYFEILKEWEKGPIFLTKTEPNGSNWDLLVYQHHNFENYDPLWSNEERYNRISWCEKQLANWANVTRKSYDTWTFKNKLDAEKFQTFYMITWSK